MDPLIETETMKLLFPLTFVVNFYFPIPKVISNYMTPEQIVRDNLDSYNLRDIGSFMSSISQDIEICNFGDAKPSLVGLGPVESFYSGLFKDSPELHSTILKRIVIGNTVIDHESIVGRNGVEESIELVLVYETRHNKIYRITVIRKLDPIA